MNTVKLLIIVLLLIGCSAKRPRHKPAPQNCSVSNVAEGALIICPDGTSALIANGVDGISGIDGEDGEDGAAGTNGSNGVNAAVTIVDPCPELTASYPEYLFFIDGNYYGVYASGTKIHLAKLVPGNYSTTDGRACSFSINALGDLIH